MIKTLGENIFRFDIFIFRLIFGWNGKKLLDAFFTAVTKSGDGYLYSVIGMALFFMRAEQALGVVAAALAAFAMELPVYLIAKKMTRRLRPCEHLDGITCLVAPPDKYSFPSGHTAAAFLMATILSLAFPFLQTPLYSWAGLIGLSRIYLGVHYPTDVLAGGALGILSAQFGIWIVF